MRESYDGRAIVQREIANFNNRERNHMTGHSVEMPVVDRDTVAEFGSSRKVPRGNE